VAQEAYTEKGTLNKEPPSDVTHAVATICLHKPWQQLQRSSLAPLHLEGITNLPLACNTRTLSILVTPSTSLLDEHLEALEGLEDSEDLEGLEILLEDYITQEEYPPLILFPYNLQEI